MNPQTARVLIDIQKERTRQDEKWGEQNHDDGRWSHILLEEIGEASKAYMDGYDQQMDVELIQAAAVLASWVESRRRKRIKQWEGWV